MDPALGLQLSAGIAAFASGLSSLEHLAKIKEFDAGGVCSPLLHIESRFGRGKLGTFLQSTQLVVATLSIRLIAALAVVLAELFLPTRTPIAFLWILVSSSAWVAWRRRVGGDGGEQMINIVLIASSIGLTFSFTASVQRAAAVFIALQSCLAYFAAGMAKLLSPLWRSGDAVRAIVNTHTHGSQGLVALLSKHSGLARMLNWGLIGAELTFPMVLIVPKEICIAILGLGLFFHLSNAVVMGLNNFVWAFLATYPCIYYLRYAIGG